MKRLRFSFVSGILAIVFAVSTAMAGQMPMGATSEPPPPTEHAVAGQMPCGITSPSDASITGDLPLGVAAGIDPVTESMLGLLQGVLALF
jgi:hypothetical protein